MTKKDYVRIAAALSQSRRVIGMGTQPDAVTDGISRLLAETLQQDNPRFDRTRFLAACGVQS